MTKSFETWEYEEVENAFGIKRVFELTALTDWLNSSKDIFFGINILSQEV